MKGESEPSAHRWYFRMTEKRSSTWPWTFHVREIMHTFKEPLQDKARREEPGQEGEGGRLAVEEVRVSPGQVLVVGRAG